MQDGGYQAIALLLSTSLWQVESQAYFRQAPQFLHLMFKDLADIFHRKGARVQDRVVKELLRVLLRKALLHVLPKLQDEVLADQVLVLVFWFVRVPLHLRIRSGSLYPILAYHYVTDTRV